MDTWRSLPIEKRGGVLQYYKNRAIRILPSYFVGILCMILISRIVGGAATTDIFHLKWIRYFLGLNTILPSNDYDTWNNLYGFWTMSCFIVFYLMAPAIRKFVTSFWKSLIFLVMSFGFFVVWKVMLTVIFSHVAEIDRLSNCIGVSPFGTLYYFALGIIAYYAIQEGKRCCALVVFLFFAIAGGLLGRSSWIWAAGTATSIIGIASRPIQHHDNCFGRIISWLSGQSFYVYLAHLMSFDLCWYLTESHVTGDIRYVVWGLSSAICIVVIVTLMNLADITVKKAMARE